MDETYGRDVAATEGIETRGTAYLVLLLTKEGVIDAEAARETIDAILEAGWYCAPDTYAKVLRKLDSFEK
jgi:predicted nucleic acid-binding protein